MGIYFNPTNESFQQTVRSHVYVDKTGLIKELNKRIGTEDKCVVVSHARRFGKSQAAGMVDRCIHFLKARSQRKFWHWHTLLEYCRLKRIRWKK